MNKLQSSSRVNSETLKVSKLSSMKKEKDFDEYDDSLKFLKVDGNTPEAVVNSDGLNSTTVVKDKNMVLLKAAEYLRNDILEHIASCDTSNWLPTVENC